MHDHNHSHESKNEKNILLAFFLNAGFAAIEFVGGYLTNSVAIYSDALHDLGDSLALLFSYFAEKLSSKKADSKFTFGYRRFSVLAALVNGLILIIGSTFILSEAISRYQNPEPVHAEGVLLLALLGLAVNGFAAFRMSKNSGANSRNKMDLEYCWEMFRKRIEFPKKLAKSWRLLYRLIGIIIGCTWSL